MKFKKQNQKERMEFIDEWAKYVKEHDDKTWSKQQNLIINSALKSSKITKKQYLKLKDED